MTRTNEVDTLKPRSEATRHRDHDAVCPRAQPIADVPQRAAGSASPAAISRWTWAEGEGDLRPQVIVAVDRLDRADRIAKCSRVALATPEPIDVCEVVEPLCPPDRGAVADPRGHLASGVDLAGRGQDLDPDPAVLRALGIVSDVALHVADRRGDPATRLLPESLQPPLAQPGKRLERSS